MKLQLNMFGEPDVIPNGTERPFYNTIHAKNPELKKYQEDSKIQEAIVLKLFEKGEKMTALEARRRTGMNQDSCKRAITNLKNKGVLIKLDEKVIEEYGKPNHFYKIR